MLIIKALRQRTMPLLLALMLLISMVLPAPSPVRAYTYNLEVPNWPTNLVVLPVGFASSIPADWKDAIRGAMAEWNAQGVVVRLVESSLSNPNIVFSKGSAHALGTCNGDPNVLACTYSTSGASPVQTTPGTFGSMGVDFNGDQAFTTNLTPGTFDVQTVALHELGHVLGLNHSSDNDFETITDLTSAVMYFKTEYIVQQGSRRSLSDYDKRALWAKYPLSGSWAAPSSGQTFGTSVHLSAHAYDNIVGGYGVDYVNFTAYYNNAWHSLCSSYVPTSGDLYGCDWNFAGASAGSIQLSFDVYGKAAPWFHHNQPDGARTITFSPASSGGGGGSGSTSCTNTPYLNSPQDGMVVARAVSFSWNPPSTCAPDGYTLRINTSSNPDTQPFIVDTGVGTSSYNYTFPSDGTYYWHVRACKTCSPYVAGPWNTARIIVDAGAGNGAQVCANTGYGTPCQEYHYTGNDASCLDLGSLRASNKSVRFIGSYAGNYDAIFYHDTSCGSYMARYSQNTPDIGSSMYNQFSSMRLERHKQPGNLQIGDYLTLSPTSMQVGQVVTAKFSVRNVGESALTVQSLGAAVRYGTSWDAPQYDFPGVANITLQPGESYFYSQQRSFTSPGGYFSQPVAQINNTWASVAGSNQVNFTASNPAAPTQADQQSTTIYDESLASGWQNWSWGSSVNLADTGRPYSGGKAIYWQPNTAYAGLFLHNDTPFNLSGYASLTFAMKGTWSGQTYAVMLYDANGNSTGSLVPLAQLGGDPPTDHFRQYVISLSVFGAVNTPITGFHIQDLTGSSTPAAAYVDRIMMGGNNGDPWVNLPASKLYAYNDSLTSGWQSWSWDSTINWTSGPSYTGANSITWTPTAGWAGLDIHNPTGVSTSSYTTVHFALKATQPGEQFAIFLAGSNNTGIKTAIPLTEYGGDPVTGYWKRYDILLADLGGNGVTITGIVIQSNLGTAQPNVYVDEVVLY